MTTPQLRLQLRITAQHITIHATGSLTARTAHQLSKTVIGILRRHTTPMLTLDLTAITTIDYIGAAALQDCEYETQRRGIVLTITQPDPIPSRSVHTARPRRAHWIRSATTGTTCAARIAPK